MSMMISRLQIELVNIIIDLWGQWAMHTRFEVTIICSGNTEIRILNLGSLGLCVHTDIQASRETCR